MQQAMASLAFLTGEPSRPVSIAAYEWLFASERWAALRTSFLHDLLTVNGLSSEPMFPLLLHYGLAALKTTACGRANHCNSLCPTCSPPLSSLASNMPPAHVTRSYLVCRISGQLMDDHNPPLVMPNGRAYSKKVRSIDGDSFELVAG